MKISGIYIITNLINNKYYIGSSKSVLDRLSWHKSHLKSRTHHNEHLQKSYNKYGKSYFTFELLEEYEDEKVLFSLENWWCNMLCTYNRDYGYNIQPINPLGIPSLSEETKIKISKANKGRKHSDDTKQKIGLSKLGNTYFKNKSHTVETKIKLKEINLGKVLLEETKEKIRQANLGKKQSEETKLKRSMALMNHKHSKETKEKLSIYRLNNPLCPNLGKKLSKESIEKRSLKRLIPVDQYDLNMIFIKTWNSATEAARTLNLNKSNISMCCNGKRNHVGGFIWLKH